MNKNYKYYKKIITICFVILFFITGCSKEVEETENINIIDIFQKQDELMNVINSCRTNVYLEMDFKEGSMGSNMLVTADMKSSIDIVNNKLSSEIETTIVMNKSKKKTLVTIIADNNEVYIKQGKTNDESIPWEVNTLDDYENKDLWEEQRNQLTGLTNTSSLAPENYVYIGDEKYSGELCYVFSQSLDAKKIMEISPGLSNQLESVEGFMPEDLEDMIESVEFTCLIDKETNYLREFRLDAVLAYEVAGEKVIGTLKQYSRYDDFNETISVEIPTI